MTLLIHGGQVLDRTQTALERADVFIEGDRIVAVGPGLAPPEGSQELDATGQIVLPGLINAHTHAHNNLTKGSGDNWTLEDQLSHGPSLNANRTPDDQYLSAALGAIEMLKTGCTAAYDLFMAVPAPTDEGVEAVVRAYIDVGLRCVVAPAVADIVFYRTIPKLLDLLPSDLRQTVESIEAAPTNRLLRVNENAIRRWNGSAGGRIRVALAPTIPGQCTDEYLSGCVRLIREYGVGLHTHLVETKVQAIHGLRRWGKTVVAHLADIGMLGPGFVGAHAVWITDEDIRLLADAGGMVAHNPAANLKLGSGIAPVREMLENGLTVGLGSDGSLSSDNQNLFEAMWLAAMVGKIRFPHHPDRWIGARDVWKMVTTGSSRILAMSDDIGAVAPGRKADLALLRADSVYLRPMNDAVNALVYAESGTSVTTVLVGGRVVLDHGRVVTVDEERIRSRGQETADRLRAQNDAAWALAEQLTPYIGTACRKAVATPYPINRYAVPIAGEV
jgi:guanine deaminase